MWGRLSPCTVSYILGIRSGGLVLLYRISEIISRGKEVKILSYEKYARIRDERKLTDYAVSKKTGISTSTFSEWKSGKYVPKVDKLMKIALVLDVQLEKLL